MRKVVLLTFNQGTCTLGAHNRCVCLLPVFFFFFVSKNSPGDGAKATAEPTDKQNAATVADEKCIVRFVEILGCVGWERYRPYNNEASTMNCKNSIPRNRSTVVVTAGSICFTINTYRNRTPTSS